MQKTTASIISIAVLALSSGTLFIAVPRGNCSKKTGGSLKAG